MTESQVDAAIDALALGSVALVGIAWTLRTAWRSCQAWLARRRTPALSTEPVRLTARRIRIAYRLKGTWTDLVHAWTKEPPFLLGRLPLARHFRAHPPRSTAWRPSTDTTFLLEAVLRTAWWCPLVVQDADTGGTLCVVWFNEERREFLLEIPGAYAQATQSGSAFLVALHFFVPEILLPGPVLPSSPPAPTLPKDVSP